MSARKFPGRWGLDWPLLGKELLEQAARKQMYVVRVAYALLLFGAFAFYYVRHLGAAPGLTLGRGIGPFRFLVNAQLAAIYLLLPPLMAGALAQEKERDTLGLLFLTDLGPWELILQKYFGRLIPMLTLLLLSLPLLAVAYSLGGVSTGFLVSAAATLFLTCLAVGALALECSAHEATTFQALIRCWGMSLLLVVFCSLFFFPLPGGARIFYYTSPASPGFLLPLLVRSIVYLLPTLFFLALTRQHLETRAFMARRNPFGYQFKQFDQYWRDMRKLVRAISRTRDREAHTLAEQVVRRHLGTTGPPASSLTGFVLARMQVPGLLASAIIVGAIVLIFVLFNIVVDPQSHAILVVVDGIWVLAALTVPIQSANVVARERMNERLAPILTTPMASREILEDWLAPVSRWIGFLARPLLILYLVDALIKFETYNASQPRWSRTGVYLGISLLAVWIYPRLVQWSCLWIGLRIHKQIRTLMTAFLAVAAWCLIPPPAAGYLAQTGVLPANWSTALQYISPITVIRTAGMFGSLQRHPGVPQDFATLAVIHLALAAGLVVWFRRQCLKNADRYLGRI